MASCYIHFRPPIFFFLMYSVSYKSIMINSLCSQPTVFVITFSIFGFVMVFETQSCCKRSSFSAFHSIRAVRLLPCNPSHTDRPSFRFTSFNRYPFTAPQKCNCFVPSQSHFFHLPDIKNLAKTSNNPTSARGHFLILYPPPETSVTRGNLCLTP